MRVWAIWFLFLASWAVALPVVAHSPAQSAQADPELEKLKKQLERHEGRLSSTMYTLTHAAESQEEVMRFLRTLAFLYPEGPKDPDTLVPDVKSVAEFKSKIGTYLDSHDDVVCATAAMFMGAIGDPAYVPRLVAELQSTTVRKGFGDDRERICKGRVAIALGLLEARQHAPQLAMLLHSRNPYDRSGATIALGLIKAKEHAKEVANLLWRLQPRKAVANEEFDPVGMDDDSPIVALVEMGVGTDYASEFALIFKNRLGGEARETAMYALARIGAKQHAAEIAELLNEEFKKGHASLALAVLKATDYTKQIVALLNDESALVRKDAALALAIMNATDASDQISQLLDAPEDFVRYYGAVALSVLHAEKYTPQILAIVEPYHAKGYHLHEGDLPPLLNEEYATLKDTFENALQKMKGRTH